MTNCSSWNSVFIAFKPCRNHSTVCDKQLSENKNLKRKKRCNFQHILKFRLHTLGPREDFVLQVVKIAHLPGQGSLAVT